jgi:hypothetical protein
MHGYAALCILCRGVHKAAGGVEAGGKLPGQVSAHVLNFFAAHAMEVAAGQGFVKLGCAHVERDMSAVTRGRFLAGQGVGEAPTQVAEKGQSAHPKGCRDGRQKITVIGKC